MLSHLSPSERALLRLFFEQIRQGGGGVSDDFSIDRYNAAQQEKTRPSTRRSSWTVLEQVSAAVASSPAGELEILPPSLPAGVHRGDDQMLCSQPDVPRT